MDESCGAPEEKVVVLASDEFSCDSCEPRSDSKVELGGAVHSPDAFLSDSKGNLGDVVPPHDAVMDPSCSEIDATKPERIPGHSDDSLYGKFLSTVNLESVKIVRCYRDVDRFKGTFELRTFRKLFEGIFRSIHP